MRCFTSDKKTQWDQWLPLLEWWYKTSYHDSTHMSPFEVVYGQNSPSVFSYLPGLSKVQEVDNTLTAQVAILRTLKDYLVMAQNHMKQQVNKEHSKCQFSEGD
jgi:hypothetical protein